MPRVRRKGKAHRGYSDSHIHELLTGQPRYGQGFNLRLHEAAALVGADGEARHAWDDLKDRLLVEWIDLRPCCRPWAWWRWDSPSPYQDDMSEGAFLAEHGLFLHEAEAAAWTAMTTDTTAGPDDGLGSPWYEVAHYDNGHVNFRHRVAGVPTDEETT